MSRKTDLITDLYRQTVKTVTRSMTNPEPVHLGFCH